VLPAYAPGNRTSTHPAASAAKTFFMLPPPL
jgi:hypothetical protein